MNGNEISQNICQTLEQNYMPYAMSVIISRAIPEIDGLKPSHRKLLYTMYTMGLKDKLTKSANVVGQTMKLNPHGDAAIYETLVRMARGNESLLHPLIESKGNFGKVYSRDMAYAASRYTECKLEPIAMELFRDIDKNTVDFVDNYDGTMKEPSLLPAAFPSILVNANQGIAVGMASNICSFNLAEICDTTIAFIKDKDHDILSTLRAPDFPTGGLFIYSREQLEQIYKTGRGSFKLRAKYIYDKKENCIEIKQIPYTTTVEAIIEKIIELVKLGRLREISDVRDESDLSGLKIAIDLKRGVDPDVLMSKLYKQTPLEDSFACNFNVLIGGMPKVCGVAELLDEWVAFRSECNLRRAAYEIEKKEARLHLMQGLKKILLDIDKAIEIIRNTEDDSEVISNLIIGFGIDEIQAEFISEIKLRNLNREHVLRRIAEVDELNGQLADLRDFVSSKARQKKLIIEGLEEIKKKFSKPRSTDIVYDDEIEVYDEQTAVEDYPVTVFVSSDGYFKKITPQSLRMSGEHKVKEGDEIVERIECSNKCELLVFTDRQHCYKAKLYEFEDGKASALGDFLPSKLGMEKDEKVLGVSVTSDFEGNMLFFFENGKCARVALASYATKQNRRKLTGAFSDKSPIVALFKIEQPQEFELTSTAGKLLIVSSAAVGLKTTRSTQGVSVMSLRGKNKLYSVKPIDEKTLVNPARYRTRNLPAAGSFLTDEDKKLRETASQVSLI